MIDAFNRLNTAMINLSITMEQFDEAMKQNMEASDKPNLKMANNTTETTSNVTQITDPVAATAEQADPEPKKKATRKKRVSKKQKETMEAQAAADQQLLDRVEHENPDPELDGEQIQNDPSMSTIPNQNNAPDAVAMADFTQVRTVVQELIAAMGDASAVEKLLFEDFGVQKLSAMDPSKYNEFIEKVKAIAAADKIPDNTIPEGLL